MGFPTDYVEPNEVQERAEIAADDVESLLAQPDSVAGVGDPSRARDLLEQLPMSVLLVTLGILRERGLLGLVAPRWQHDKSPYHGTRLGRVLYIFGVSNMRGADHEPPRDAMANAAQAIDALSDEGRADALRYLMDKRSLPRDVEILVEGFAAFEGVEVEWREPVPVAGTTIGSEEPEPVEPAAWNKPAGEPAELYIGKEAHDAIARHYRIGHRGETVYINHTPLSTILDELADMSYATKPDALTVSQMALRPDILNLTRLYVYEIKPVRNAVEASGRASMYIGVMGRAGVTVALGPPGAPGTSGTVAAPGGVFIFSSPSPGVITYQYRRGRLVPVPVTAEQEHADDSPAKSEKSGWRWQLEPIPEEERRRLLVTVVITMGAIILAIITAPASS